LNPHIGYAAEIAKESVNSRRPEEEIALERYLLEEGVFGKF
jgi:aspartate ammonia-lyase